MHRLLLMLSLGLVMGVGGLGGGVASVAQAAGAPNSTCPGGVLSGGPYNNVTVLTGKDCFIDLAIIEGNLVAQAGSSLTVEVTTIGGNLQDQHGASLYVYNSTIGGNLQVGHVTQYVQVVSSRVGGDGQFTNNTGAVNIDGNGFGGNLQVNNNTGGALVTDNILPTGNLSCQGNMPPPNSFGNIAKSYSGQCLA